MHLQKREQPVKDRVHEYDVVQTADVHHGVHGHLQAVEHQSAQTEH